MGTNHYYKGIGNGVSLLIFLNIVSRMPGALSETLQKLSGNKFLVPILVLGALVTFAVLLITVVQLELDKYQSQYVGKGFSGKMWLHKILIYL